MPEYNITVSGLEVSFRTNAGESRVREAEHLIRRTFNRLNTYGNRLSNEKLLILVALSLADDYLQTRQKLRDYQDELNRLVETIDNGEYARK